MDEEQRMTQLYERHQDAIRLMVDAVSIEIKNDLQKYGKQKAGMSMLIWIDNYLNDQKKEGIRLKKPQICKTGCSACCHSEILTSDLEFEMIKLFIKTYNVDVDWDLVDKQQGTMEENSQLPWEDRKCPLLKNNKCSIYPVRPIVCRAYNSVDKDPVLCKKEYGYQDSRNATHQQQIMLYAEAMQIALAEIEGRYANSFPLLTHKLKEYSRDLI